MTPRLFISRIVDAVVGPEGGVAWSESTSRDMLVLAATVRPEQHGRVIGRHGSVVDGLRILLTMACRKFERRCTLRVVTPERFNGVPPPFEPNLFWKHEWLAELSAMLANRCFLKPVVVTVTDRSDASTLVQFRLCATEPSPLPDEVVQNAFIAVMKAIGMSNGRKIRFELKRA